MDPTRYLNWQKKLNTNKRYRQRWVFFGIYSVVVVFGVGAALIFTRNWGAVIVAVIAFVIARGIFSPLIYLFYKKARPYQKYLFTTIHSRFFSSQSARFNSFPSDHAVSFASIGAIFFWYVPWAGAVVLVVAAVNGYARIILGYHDQWDIASGWVVGILAAVLTILFIAPIILNH